MFALLLLVNCHFICVSVPNILQKWWIFMCFVHHWCSASVKYFWKCFMQMIHKATAAVAFQAIVHFITLFHVSRFEHSKFVMVIAAATLTVCVLCMRVSAVCSAQCTLWCITITVKVSIIFHAFLLPHIFENMISIHTGCCAAHQFVATINIFAFANDNAHVKKRRYSSRFVRKSSHPSFCLHSQSSHQMNIFQILKVIPYHTNKSMPTSRSACWCKMTE